MSAVELCLTQILASFVFNLFRCTTLACIARVWLHFDPRVNIGHGIRLMVLPLELYRCAQAPNPEPNPSPFQVLLPWRLP